MRIVGLIGGISWVSTLDYYRYINVGVNERLGGNQFSECLIHSFNYADIRANNEANDWEKTFRMLSDAGKNLKAGGAEAIALCANTMHHIADRVEREVGLPLIHIVDATAASIGENRVRKVGLLGTKFTMELDFFTSRLATAGIETLIPEADDRDFLHYTIGHELGGKEAIPESTRRRYLEISNRLIDNGAEGIILGCTEIPLVLSQDDFTVPVFDTTRLHAAAIVDFQVGACGGN